ncbi:hypothetical protein FSP39_003077 [Pinctada imbricata]|uniref:SH3 domain-containing protein n=1 Tax=Pinctada imbricata TaxID=66713 RepID=A0AA89C6A8_PINIB|nr:hypothetical protein FSP39_003077 [Pinctada imbricata]
MFSVLVEYEPSRKGDLLLTEGDRVDKVKDIGHGWLLGRNVTTGKKGAFPDGCIDRDTTVSGAIIRQFSRKPRTVRSAKDLRMTVIKSDSNNIPGKTDGECSEDAAWKAAHEHHGLQSDDKRRKLVFFTNLFLRIASAIICSGIVYLLLVYSFGYSFATAGYVVVGVFMFLLLGLVLSPLIRCVVLVMVTNMFTNRGRGIILSIITGLLLSGPSMNVSYNTEEQCDEGLRRAENECTNGNNRARKTCKDSINRIDPTDTITDSITDTVEDIIGGLGRRKKRATNTTLVGQAITRTLVKRRAFSSICNIFDVSRGVCGALGSVSTICNPLNLISNTMMRAAKSALDAIEEVTEFFDYRIVNDVDLSGSATASKNASTIVNEIREEIMSKTEAIRSIFSIINRILSTSLLFLFFTSLNYVLKYRKKMKYDNRYITTAFVQLDEDCKRKGKETVLPLRKKEKKKYMFTTSKGLSMIELSGLKESAAFLLHHFISAVIIIAFDYILYYVLALIQQYAMVALTVEGVNTIDVEVEGNGVFTIFLRTMISTIDLNSTYSVDFNFTTCLPNPSSPGVFSNSIIMSLYILALFMLIMQAYGSRLRRKIASSYYPEQEKSRILYLHDKIICDRIAFKALMKDQVYRRRKENAVRGHIRPRGCFTDKLSCLFGLCDVILPEKRSCDSCDLIAGRRRLFIKCQNRLCNAIFCQECVDVMEGTCFVCDERFEIRGT